MFAVATGQHSMGRGRSVHGSLKTTPPDHTPFVDRSNSRMTTYIQICGQF